MAERSGDFVQQRVLKDAWPLMKSFLNTASSAAKEVRADVFKFNTSPFYLLVLCC